MGAEEMMKAIASLETMVDYLQTTLSQLDVLLQQVGFEGGIKTLEEAAHALLEDPSFKPIA